MPGRVAQALEGREELRFGPARGAALWRLEQLPGRRIEGKGLAEEAGRLLGGLLRIRSNALAGTVASFRRL